MVPASFVEHNGGYTTKIYDASKTSKYAEDKIKFVKKWRKSSSFILKKKLISIFKNLWLIASNK